MQCPQGSYSNSSGACYIRVCTRTHTNERTRAEIVHPGPSHPSPIHYWSHWQLHRDCQPQAAGSCIPCPCLASVVVSLLVIVIICRGKCWKVSKNPFCKLCCIKTEASSSEKISLAHPCDLASFSYKKALSQGPELVVKCLWHSDTFRNTRTWPYQSEWIWWFCEVVGPSFRSLIQG